ncbi:MAG: hypothetical protein KAJ79_02195 [Candidatus Omnitrophica bacterium]|nr:hypothetical protein [Candidatus Omnitrophota bacterium]
MRKFLEINVFFIIFLFWGCNNPTQDISKKEKTSNQIKDIKEPLLAKINNWEISLNDFNERLFRIDSYGEIKSFDINDFQARKDMLSQLVTVEILYQIGIEKGVDKLEDIISLTEKTKRIAIVDKVMVNLEKEVSIDEIVAFYENNKDLIGMPLLEEKENIRNVLFVEKLNNEIAKVILDFKKRNNVEINDYLLKD